MQSVLHFSCIGHFRYELFDLLKLLFAPTLKTSRVVKDQVRAILTDDWNFDVVDSTGAFGSFGLQVARSATRDVGYNTILTSSTPKISLINVDLPTPVFPQTRMRIAPGSSILTVSLSPQKTSCVSTVLRNSSMSLRKRRALESRNTLVYSSNIKYTEGCRVVPCAASSRRVSLCKIVRAGYGTSNHIHNSP